MSKRFLLLLAMVFLSLSMISTLVSCPGAGGELLQLGTVAITNDSEHNITWVMIIDAHYTGTTIFSERKSELIAKDSLYSFDVEIGHKTVAYGAKPSFSKIIICIKAEDTPELMCVDEFELYEKEIKTLVWNGKDNPAWKPMQRCDPTAKPYNNSPKMERTE
jgi:hypothetical protein